MVLGDQLHQALLRLLEEREVLHQIEEPHPIAGPPDHGLEGNDPLLAFGIDPLPLGEMLPLRRDAADPALATIRENDESVVPEELRDSRLVVAEVVAESRLDGPMRCLEFHKQKRQPVHEPNQIGPPRVQLTRDPELRRQEEAVVLRRIPVNNPNPLASLFVRSFFSRSPLLPCCPAPLHPCSRFPPRSPAPLLLCRPDLHPILQQPIDLLVRCRRTHPAAIASELLDRLRDRLGRRLRVQLLQRRPEPPDQDNLCGSLSPQRAPACLLELMEAVGGLPLQLTEQRNRRLLDQFIFRIASHVTVPQRYSRP